MKSRFLLSGSFFPGGNHDLDHFFYEYRVDAVKDFVREVFQQVRKIKPRIEVSAAVFKDPILSGRFIGQDWREYSEWVQYAMPMDYRSHFPGDFEIHLNLLEEAIERQKALARDYEHLWIGVATAYIYDEERAPLTRMRELLGSGGQADDIRREFNKVSARLRQYGPDLTQAIENHLRDPKDSSDVQKKLQSFLARVPPGYYSPEKFERTLERVRKSGVEGIVIFSAGGIGGAGLWDSVEKSFAGDAAGSAP
jgi:hypothetical protein